MTLLILTTIAVTVLAQAARPDRGIMPLGSYSMSGLDSISLTNGNMNLSIPLASLPPLPGGRLGWTLSANYNSKLWDVVSLEQRDFSNLMPGMHPPISVSRDLQLGGGWSLGQPYRIDVIESRLDYDWVPPLSGGTDPSCPECPPLPPEPDYQLLTTPPVFVNQVSKGWGSLKQMTTPTGARVQYSYSLDFDEQGSYAPLLDPLEAPRESVFEKRVIHDGAPGNPIEDIWHYGVTPFSGGVTGPDGLIVVEDQYPHDKAFQQTFGGNDGRSGLVYRTRQSDKVVIERRWALMPFANATGGTTGARGLRPFNPVVTAEFTTLMEGNTAQKMSAKKYQYDCPDWCRQ